VKSTIVGGIFVLVPLVILSIVVGHALQAVIDLITPVVHWLPFQTIAATSLALLIGIAGLILGCFVAGLLARTAISQWFVGSLEQLILSFVPSYGLMKSMGQGWVGADTADPHPTVLVRLDDAQQIGFVMDTLADKRCVVFIPDVPTPWSGTLMIVAADRIEPLPLSTKQTIDCLRRLGVNTSALLAREQTA
jgi:uncharacterized membrane protein